MPPRASAVPDRCCAMRGVAFGDGCGQQRQRPGVGGKRGATLFSTLDLIPPVFIGSQRLLLSPVSTAFDVFDGAYRQTGCREIVLKKRRNGQGWMSFKRPHDGESVTKASISTTPSSIAMTIQRSRTAVVFHCLSTPPILPPPPCHRWTPLCPNSDLLLVDLEEQHQVIQAGTTSRRLDHRRCLLFGPPGFESGEDESQVETSYKPMNIWGQFTSGEGRSSGARTKNRVVVGLSTKAGCQRRHDSTQFVPLKIFPTHPRSNNP